MDASVQEDVSSGTAHHGRMILRTAVVNFISQIDFFLANRQKQVAALEDEKLCRLVTSALRSLHATLAFQAEHEQFRDNWVEYEFSTLIELLMFKVFREQVNSESSGGFAKRWLTCNKWALRLTSLLVELLTTAGGGSHLAIENEMAIRKLTNKLVRILAHDLTQTQRGGHLDKWDRSSKASVAQAARLLNRVLAHCKLARDQLARLVTSLALPLAAKYVTDNRLCQDGADPRVYLSEFTLSYELERELQVPGDLQISSPARKSVHSATTCLLVRLIELASQRDRTRILASLGPFYEILDRAVSRAADTDKHVSASSPDGPTDSPRELLVALLVIVRFEFDGELGSQRCRRLFTKLVLLPILAASSGYLRARLYWLMQDFYCKTASLLPEVLARLVVHAYDDLSASESLVLQTSAARFLQALVASGDLKSLTARNGQLKQADLYSRIEVALKEKQQELPQADGDEHQHEWHWI